MEIAADPRLAKLPDRIETDRHGPILTSAPEICIEVFSPSTRIRSYHCVFSGCHFARIAIPQLLFCAGPSRCSLGRGTSPS
jgi:hypothetical protein